MKLTVKEQEILCSLDLDSNADAKQQQLKFASHLAEVFEHGSIDASIDKWKAAKYHKQANPDFNEPNATVLRTQSVYEVSHWYNFIRLYVLRVDLVVEAYSKSFLGRYFSFFGFAYVLDFLFDLTIVLKTTFDPHVSNFEKDMSFWERSSLRFKNVVTKDGRLSRMINSGLWGALNVATFILTGGLSLILTAVGCVLDIINTVVTTFIEYENYKLLLDKVTQKLEQKKSALSELEENNQFDVSSEKIKLTRDIARYQLEKDQLSKNLKKVKLSAFYNVFSTAIILIGFGLILFPPTSAAGVVLTILGLGMNLVEKIDNARNHCSITVNELSAAKPLPPKTDITITTTPTLTPTHQRCYEVLAKQSDGQSDHKKPLSVSVEQPPVSAETIKIEIKQEAPNLFKDKFSSQQKSSMAPPPPMMMSVR